MIRSLFLALPLVLVAASAADIDCNNAMDQNSMNMCADIDYQAADKKLNDVYRKVTAALDDAKYQAKLKAAERAWIKFRDAQCTHAAATFEGGSMQPQVHVECLPRLTKARAKELQDYLACKQTDGVCE